MTAKLIERIVLIVRRFLYANRGEPYEFAGNFLRFTLGSRPIRTKYRNSNNANVRNDALQVELIADSLNSGDTAIDIGAHRGQYGVLMSSRCGHTGNVFCFEPDPEALEGLLANLALNPQIKPPTIVKAACSDTNGTTCFYTQGGNSQSSLAESALPVGRPTTKIQVQTMRLDDWYMDNRIAEPKLIKIDTEGAEIHILRGMPNILRDCKATIVCELHPFAWEEMGVSLHDLDEIVALSGRTMRWLDGSGVVSSPVPYGTVLLELQ
jgi:FkbM family methyltransferase